LAGAGGALIRRRASPEVRPTAAPRVPSTGRNSTCTNPSCRSEPLPMAMDLDFRAALTPRLSVRRMPRRGPSRRIAHRNLRGATPLLRGTQPPPPLVAAAGEIAGVAGIAGVAPRTEAALRTIRAADNGSRQPRVLRAASPSSSQ